MQGWAKVKQAAKYAGVSERTLEEWLRSGLKYAQLPSGLRLIKYEWIDEYLQGFTAQDKVEEIVSDVLAKI